MAKKSDPNKIQSTLDGLKRSLQKEREEAETMRAHLTLHREPLPPPEESRAKKYEAVMAAAQQELAKQKETNVQLLQQLAAERDSHRARLSEVQAATRRIEEELAAAQGQARDQKESAEKWIRQLTAERDDGRSRLREMETWTRTLEDELANARQQVNEQEKLAETIREITAERDESRAQFTEVESRIQVLGDELAAAQQQFREQREMAVNVIRSLEAERDQLRAQLGEQETLAEKLEEELTSSPKPPVEPPSPLGALERALGGGPDFALAGTLDGRPELWRMALSLTLMLLSSEPPALSLRSNPETQDAVREIQLGGLKLLELLRTVNLPTPVLDSARSDQPAEPLRETVGPLGTITPA